MNDQELISSYAVGSPLEEASTLSADWYTRPSIAELEKRRVFYNSWQYFCSARQLSKPGTFVTGSIAGQPILATRTKDGTLRAMANVCRHRAARVETRPEGEASRFRCRYHGWAYDLGGNLCGTPDFKGVACFKKEEHPLPPFAIREWGPFIFVHMNQNDCASMWDDFIEPLEAYKDALQSSERQYHSRKEWVIPCNWKIFVDNYQDGGYHIPTLHPDLSKVVNMDTYHTKLFNSSSLQLSPLKEARATQSAEVLNDVRSGSEALYFWLFPNFMLNIYDGNMDINTVEPIDEKSCRVVFDFYFSEKASKSYIEESLKVSDQVQDEDIEICAEVQRNLSTGSFDTGRFSVRRESGGHLFHKLIAERMRT